MLVAQERVVAAGGRVLNNSGLRVMGVLQCTRAIGDRDLQPFGVIPVPDVLSLPRTGQEEFLILATDGLWDVLSNEVSYPCLLGGSSATRLHNCLFYSLQFWNQAFEVGHWQLIVHGAVLTLEFSVESFQRRKCQSTVTVRYHHSIELSVSTVRIVSVDSCCADTIALLVACCFCPVRRCCPCCNPTRSVLLPCCCRRCTTMHTKRSRRWRIAVLASPAATGSAQAAKQPVLQPGLWHSARASSVAAVMTSQSCSSTLQQPAPVSSPLSCCLQPP